MVDRATPNFPARDLARTSAFFAALGFVEMFRDEGWMILRRGGLALEFFPDPSLDLLGNDHSCCLRLDDVDAFHALTLAAGIPEATRGLPRLQAPQVEPWGGRVGALFDPDGNLLRLIGA